jgi:DNA polymerase-4
MEYKKKYKSMQALRSISKEQRSTVENLNDILTSLCMTLEKRMMRQKVFSKEVSITVMYSDEHKNQNGENHWNDYIKLNAPLQDGAALLTLVKERIKRFEKLHQCESIINTDIRRLGVGVYNFVPDEMIQAQLFEKNVQKDKLRKTMFNIKKEYGYTRLMRATELNENKAYKDVIGFGSVKDLETFSYDLSELDKLQKDFAFDYAASPVEDNEIEIKENFENDFYE